MTTILDAALHVGLESTYGTAATLTRSFEAHADSWKREQQFLESVGMRAGIQAVRSDRRPTVNLGGSGTIELDFQTKGMGLLLQGSLGTKAIAQQGATAAWLQTFTTDPAAPSDSFTIQVVRPFTNSGTTQQFTHKGCVFTKWSLKQDVDKLLVWSADFDFQDVDTTTAAGTATYPATNDLFHWDQCTVTIGGSAFDVKDFSFEADLAQKVDRRYLRGSALKKQPKRGAMPTYTGTMTGDFDNLTQYNNFTAGTIVPIVAKWTGAQIVNPHNYELTLTLQACQFTGESPQVSLSDLPSQALPFKVLHDGTNPAVSLTYKSTDTAY